MGIDHGHLGELGDARCDLHGRMFIGGVPDPELALLVPAHGVEAAAVLEEETVVVACGDLDDPGGDDLHGRILLGQVPGPELAVAVPAHGVEAAAVLEEETVAGEVAVGGGGQEESEQDGRKALVLVPDARAVARGEGGGRGGELHTRKALL
ncbi:MAG: hypothetical protein VCA36_03155 [Opitutales bacterium]